MRPLLEINYDIFSNSEGVIYTYDLSSSEKSPNSSFCWSYSNFLILCCISPRVWLYLTESASILTGLVSMFFKSSSNFLVRAVSFSSFEEKVGYFVLVILIRPSQRLYSSSSNCCTCLRSSMAAASASWSSSCLCFSMASCLALTASFISLCSRTAASRAAYIWALSSFFSILRSSYFVRFCLLVLLSVFSSSRMA